MDTKNVSVNILSDEKMVQVAQDVDILRKWLVRRRQLRIVRPLMPEGQTLLDEHAPVAGSPHNEDATVVSAKVSSVGAVNAANKDVGFARFCRRSLQLRFYCLSYPEWYATKQSVLP
jgi:hypothetical protein